MRTGSGAALTRARHYRMRWPDRLHARADDSAAARVEARRAERVFGHPAKPVDVKGRRRHGHVASSARAAATRSSEHVGQSATQRHRTERAPGSGTELWFGSVPRARSDTAEGCLADGDRTLDAQHGI